MGTYQFGRFQHPAFTDDLITDAENGAWDDLGPMSPIGVVRHTMVGTLAGTRVWFRRGASSTGLTNYGVGKDGKILRWNDPLGKPHPGISANRAGWANGGSDGLEGDGPLFVRKLGVNAINRNLVSIERDDQGQPFTDPYVDPQALAIDRLIAYWMDYANVPWDKYPLNPAFGCVTDFWHLEFATKGCPHEPVIAATNASQDRVRGFLNAAQTGGLDVPVTPPVPIETDKDELPMGYTRAELNTRFGILVWKRADGTVRRSGFNMKGAISNAWIARAAAEQRAIADIPPASYAASSVDSRLQFAGNPAEATIVLFDGRGADNWILYRPDESIAWRWMV